MPLLVAFSGLTFTYKKSSKDADKNGLGSIRLIKSFPAPPFEETIEAYEPNNFIAYEVRKTAPLKIILASYTFPAREREFKIGLHNSL